MPITPGAGIHPDLIDEADQTMFTPGPGQHPDLAADGGRTAAGATTTAEAAKQISPEETPKDEHPTGTEPKEGEGARNTPVATAGETPAAAEPETPAWLDALRGTKDPKEALAVLTANLPKEELARDKVLAGLIGDLGQRKARELVANYESQQRDQQKADAASKGDYYALGELTAPETLQRLRTQAEQQALEPLMEGVRLFQANLPAEVQAEIAGRNWPGTPAEGLRAYMDAAVQSAIKHGLEPEVEREIRRREPSLRKQVLSAAYGSEPSPELGSGSPKGVVEITDVQLENMSLADYEQHFDAYGHPKEGVKFIVTRGESVRSR